MSRLRQRVAERLVARRRRGDPDHVQRSQHAAGDRAAQRYKDRFEKEHGVKLGFMGFFVKAACTR